MIQLCGICQKKEECGIEFPTPLSTGAHVECYKKIEQLIKPLIDYIYTTFPPKDYGTKTRDLHIIVMGEIQAKIGEQSMLTILVENPDKLNKIIKESFTLVNQFLG